MKQRKRGKPLGVRQPKLKHVERELALGDTVAVASGPRAGRVGVVIGFGRAVIVGGPDGRTRTAGRFLVQVDFGPVAHDEDLEHVRWCDPGLRKGGR